MLTQNQYIYIHLDVEHIGTQFSPLVQCNCETGIIEKWMFEFNFASTFDDDITHHDATKLVRFNTSNTSNAEW